MNKLLIILVLLLLIAGGIIARLLWPKPEPPIHISISSADSAAIVEQAWIGFVKYDYDKFVEQFGQVYKDTSRIPVYDTTYVKALIAAFTDTSAEDSGSIILPEMNTDVQLSFAGVDSSTEVKYQIEIALNENFIPPPLDIRRHAVLDSLILEFPPQDTVFVHVDSDLLWKVAAGSFVLGMLTLAVVN